MKKAVWNGKVIAESDAVIELEGNLYFPPESLKKEYLQNSETTSTCPWKGEAHYYHIEAGGESNRDAAWYYPQPKEAARQIKGYVAFWKGVEVIED
jgi:uncharacterized protein (DUF427 family)